MAAQKQRITIIGTGRIGASMGMALRQSQDAPRLELVGHDCELATARQALKLGAFDRVEFNLDVALRGAKLIIIAVPLAALREVLQDIGRLVNAEGVVITDTAPLKAPVKMWAKELLPEGCYYVGADPFLAPASGGWEMLEGPAAARSDLFKDAVYAITAQPDDHPSAVHAVTNLAFVLGAEPYLMDPGEHDAVRVWVNALPDMAASSLFRSVTESHGWAEMRRAAERSFATATAAAAGDVASRRMLAQLGQPVLIEALDGLVVQLQALRQALAEGDGAVVEAILQQATRARELWLLQSQERTWEPAPPEIEHESLFERTMKTLVGERLAKL
jgi:prephenate dehydrogenase